ncbi:xylulose kinase-like isoform X1 [Haliotis rubra]|uniref:xylulose kinase-like isoform X1 n=1 Tax=Haliotis rubra TaxID=36100 RepID=UPI001EE504DC|nr:xylulose kinase-like isoform X1 [Haliotis rubra]
MAEEGRLFLGVEISTQQIKTIAINSRLDVTNEYNVKFDTELPEYKTHGGANIHEDHVTVTAPTAMWVKALDLLLDTMKADNFPFSRVAALSGTGQQHGSVYWKKGARDTLSSLNPSKSFSDQLQDCFSIRDSPIWMDASTTKQCRDLEEKVGGPQSLTDITGSRGYERLTGNQIAKQYQTQRAAYENTERISLVSSFAACLFIGDYAPIDDSDGSGMNLMDIRTRKWSPQCLDACAPNLDQVLGPIVPSAQLVGKVSQFLVERYDFSPNCQVGAFTGDNPASLAGLAPKQGDLIVSLGTSDTVFLWLTEPKPALVGHIFANPVDTTAYMALLCFKNGSLTRERVRDDNADKSWDKFGELLQKSPLGNNGNIGIYFDITEIQPVVEGVYRFNEKDEEVSSFPPEVEVRALIEGQFMARRVYSETLGFQIDSNTRVIATGGASMNTAILQVLSDVFNAPVYIKDVANSAALGCAFRAKHSWLGPGVPSTEVVKGVNEPVCVATPTPGADKIYEPLCARYKVLEEKIAQRNS